jgi:23S rRNA (cytidine1920-2'-O)/16S rRNA (cytidine1409-2'-O)-methyltransferase
MSKDRLDKFLAQTSQSLSRSQAESFIRLGKVKVDGQVIKKPGHLVSAENDVKLDLKEQYVSRAGLKLASVAQVLRMDVRDKVILDVGSSTGGFTDYCLQKGARKVIAVDVGTNQLHPLLRTDGRIELHEQTDIRAMKTLSDKPDYVVIDVSFISLRDVSPHIAKIAGKGALIVAMVKPQFEAQNSNVRHKGVIKNERIRRDILKDFEQWTKAYFKIIDKADSQVSGEKGNKERFYLLSVLA